MRPKPYNRSRSWLETSAASDAGFGFAPDYLKQRGNSRHILNQLEPLGFCITVHVACDAVLGPNGFPLPLRWVGSGLLSKKSLSETVMTPQAACWKAQPYSRSSVSSCSAKNPTIFKGIRTEGELTAGAGVCFFLHFPAKSQVQALRALSFSCSSWWPHKHLEQGRNTAPCTALNVCISLQMLMTSLTLEDLNSGLGR